MYKYCPNCGSKIESPKNDPIKCIQCGKTFYSNSKPTVSVIPVYEDEMLLTIRAIDPKKGELDFIGGFLKSGEEPLEGAVREFKEETGMDLDKNDLEFLGVWVDEYEYDGTKYFTFNLDYVVRFSGRLMLKPSDDVAELVWLPINKEHKFAFKSLRESIKALRSFLKK
jgi:ADP-ribose pyrophosphatase YjhB (NUDIX family)